MRFLNLFKYLPQKFVHKEKILKIGDEGNEVLDLQIRLSNLGFTVSSNETAVKKFGPDTQEKLKAFQKFRGLKNDGILDHVTIEILIEATFKLGNRQLYLQSPMLKGDDVFELQTQLGKLGFDVGRIDGIFGPQTVKALIDFQKNFGLIEDGIAGHETIRNLQNIKNKETPDTQISKIKEIEHLRNKSTDLGSRRLVIGHFGNSATLANATARMLRKKGAKVIDLNNPDEEVQARTANGFEAEMYLGFNIENNSQFLISYFKTKNSQSEGGLRLASQCSKEMDKVLQKKAETQGMQIPILRATRMPAIMCSLGPIEEVIKNTDEIAHAFAKAISNWFQEPSKLVE